MCSYTSLFTPARLLCQFLSAAVSSSSVTVSRSFSVAVSRSFSVAVSQLSVAVSQLSVAVSQLQRDSFCSFSVSA